MSTVLTQEEILEEGGYKSNWAIALMFCDITCSRCHRSESSTNFDVKYRVADSVSEHRAANRSSRSKFGLKTGHEGMSLMTSHKYCIFGLGCIDRFVLKCCLKMCTCVPVVMFSIFAANGPAKMHCHDVTWHAALQCIFYYSV